MTPTEDILFVPLGGSSIGGSAHLVRVGDTVVLLDCGIDPNSPPTKTLRELQQRAKACDLVGSLTDVRAVAITHAHTDHSGLLPGLYRLFREQGKRVPPFYATAATKGLLPLVYKNAQRFSMAVPYSRTDVDLVLSHITQPERDGRIDWASSQSVGHLRFHPTSHLLGSVMVELEIRGRRILYTGDLHIGQTPTLPSWELPSHAPDLLIVDGTYAAADSSRQLRSWEQSRQDLFGLLDMVVENRGIALLPSFAMGRSQDILTLVLEHAESRPANNYKVYMDGQSSYVTNSVYPRFRHLLSKHCLELWDCNQWRVQSIEQSAELSPMLEAEMTGYPCVVIASSGMLLPESASRRWAEALIGHAQNVVAFTGYILEDVEEEVFDRGLLGNRTWRNQPRRLGCSSHASLSETEDFIDRLRPGAVAIVHCGSGDLQGPGSLYDRLISRGKAVVVGQDGQVLSVSGKGVLASETKSKTSGQ